MTITVGAAGWAQGGPSEAGPTEPAEWEPKLTALFTRTVRKVSFALTFATSFSALSPSPSFAFSAEAQQVCTGDAFRLCSSDVPNIPKITACMYKHRSELRSGCRAVMDRDLAKGSSKVAEQ
jgi:hypothetical protein